MQILSNKIIFGLILLSNIHPLVLVQPCTKQCGPRPHYELLLVPYLTYTEIFMAIC